MTMYRYSDNILRDCLHREAKVSSKVSIECCYSVIIKVSVKQIRCFITADIGFQWHSRVVRGYDQKDVRGYNQKVVRGHGVSK